MKKILLTLIFINSLELLAQNCSTCPDPGLRWDAIQCEHYDFLGPYDDLLTQHWFLYPSTSNYRPISAKIGFGHISPTNPWYLYAYADFIYKGVPIDNYYVLDIGNREYRFSFYLYTSQGKKARISISDASLTEQCRIIFQGNGIAEIFNTNDVKIGSFSYSQVGEISMNFFYHGDGKMEIFRDNYKVSELIGFSTGDLTFPSRMNFYSNESGDEFLLGGVCLVTSNTFFLECAPEDDPQCLNGTNEEIAPSKCDASIKGYLGEEIHDCGNVNDPCSDCDECFNYFFDCLDSRTLYLVNNYCDNPVYTYSNNTKEFQSGTEYLWEFKNSNNDIIQPEYTNNTNSSSFNPICRFANDGVYTVCLKVYKYQENGRYLAFICCYTIKVGLPCNKTPTLYINAGIANSNNEVTLTTTTTDAESFSWRVNDPDAYITNQSITSNSFKCKIPNGSNCVTVCLTVGNGCGMISECITVCNNNNPCGNKPPSHPPVYYKVENSGEVNFSNIPLMDSYEWVLPSGCTFVSGTNSSSRSPVCKLPDINCSYLICLKMQLGSCYVYCYCFTIRPKFDTPITFDVDDLPCVSNNAVIKVPIRVKSFTDVTSVDMYVNINPANVAKFSNASPGQNIDPSTFIVQKINDSRMRISWAGTSGAATSLNNNDIFCYLDMIITGTANSKSTLTIESNTNNIKQNRIQVTPILKTGSICVNGAYSLCGKIAREDNIGVANVDVNLIGSTSFTTKTDNQGNYCFNNIPEGAYTIKPKKNLFPGNGIQIDDIADIKGHLLRKFVLPTPYRIIAADADNSRTLTSTDIARIINVFKNPNTPFSNVDSWRFIPTAFSFPNENNPFQSIFPEMIDIQLMQNMTDVDFVGIKVGDVVISNDPTKLIKINSNVILQNLKTRSIPKIILQIKDDSVSPGGKIRVPIYADGFNKVVAFGFSLSWQESKLKFNKLSNFNSKINLTNSDFNLTNTDKGQLGVSWFTLTSDGISLRPDEPLFYVEFTAIGMDQEVSQVSFSQTPTPISFADIDFNFDLELRPGKISIDKRAVATKFYLENDQISIQPNPTKDYLKISFPKNINKNFELKIFNANGQDCEFKIIDKEHIQISHLQSGIYFLQVKSKDKLQTIRFVKI